MWQYFLNKHHQFQLVCECRLEMGEKGEKMYFIYFVRLENFYFCLYAKISNNRCGNIDDEMNL
jgi:hypothetical protein